MGQLAGIKDFQTIKHYEQVLEKNREQLPAQADFSDRHPNIYGSFTGWRPEKMKNLLEFLIQNDVYKPDFAAKAYE